ncbi:phage tail protein [Paenibacillus oenotherae]|uniref:Phage tail protein n=1 Tax=Paenibacillus oenotherae TaxID=1435645 RepID=A0ABS7D2A9_9BACL|nr:phage tail spike protein [Paenibacillus oenotherae]MBW7474077.1 phage tail protein [Paenibacillus oenotherae]
MLGDIDYNLKPVEAVIFIAKPNREIIAKVSEAYDKSRSLSLTSLFSFSFKIPFYVEQNSELVRNRNADLIKERYHIKVQIGNQSEWYIVTKIMDTTGNQGDSKEIECLYLPQELNDKLISRYEAVSLNAREVLNDILSTSIWSIDTLDADFELTRRSFEFLDNTLLDAVYAVAETYNAIIQWDTVNRTISFIKPELHGMNRLGTLSHQKYLKSIGKESNAEVIVTRLIPEGRDSLGIQEINPTGQGYIEDFSYFMYPFSRDNSGNVLKHSHYMSDSLCHALLDFKALVEDNEGVYNSLLAQKTALDSAIDLKNAERDQLIIQLKGITEIQIRDQFNFPGAMYFEKFNYEGSPVTKTFAVIPQFPYAVLCQIDDGTGIALAVDGQARPIASSSWEVVHKVPAGAGAISVSLNGSGHSGVFMQVMRISTEEFQAADNGTAIIQKYNFDNKEQEIVAKDAELASLHSQLTTLNQAINNIRTLLGPDNNFTPAQLDELNLYILVHEFKDDTYIEEEDLLQAAKDKFKELNTPQLSIKIDLLNFMEVMEEQRSWNQLRLGDKVIISYEMFDLKVEAKIIEMSFDYESSSINLTIAHFKDLTNSRSQLEKYVYDSRNTTNIVDIHKSRWGQAVVDTSEFSQLFDHFWDKVTNQINMAVNQTVAIDDKGITITDPNDPLRFLRMTNGAIGLTRSGGLRYETALSADGVIAEMVLGKLILGQRVTIGDQHGIWLTEGPKTTITDRCGREAMKLGLYQENPDLFGIVVNRYDGNAPCSPDLINKVIINSEDGMKIQQWNGTAFVDKFYADHNGLLFAEDMTTKRLKIVSDTNELMLDSNTKYMNLGKFDDIIVDGKLTAIEKLQVLGERTRIISEYQKLLLQANTYKTTSRDLSIRIDPAAFTTAYNALIAYLTPLLANMSETTAIDRTEFIALFKSYYDEATNIIQAVNDSIKFSSLQLGSMYNNVLIHASEGITVTRSDTMYRSLMNATKGFAIQKNVGTDQSPNWQDQFWADMNGVVHVQDIKIRNSFMTDGEIKGSSITLGTHPNIMRLDPNLGGFWAGHENSAQAPAHIGMDGTATFRKLAITNGSGGVMLDSENKVFDMDLWNMVGAGRIESDSIVVNTVIGGVGFISNLAVNKLVTFGQEDDKNEIVDYIHIEDEIFSLRTGKITNRFPVYSNGAQLYWTDASKSKATTTVTSYPVYNLEVDNKDKMVIKFEREPLPDDTAYPVIQMGAGDGTALGAKAFIKKPSTSWDFTYYSSGTPSRERKLAFNDAGIIVYSNNGIIKIEHSTGTCFEITTNGNDITMKHKTAGTITLNASGLTADITGNMNFNASGQINFSGTQYNFA